MTSVRCPRCGAPARHLASSIHIAMVLPCGCWVARAEALRMAERARAEKVAA